MEKASPVEMRKALQVVDGFKKAMIEFVPIPVLDGIDREHLRDQLLKRMDRIYEEAENLDIPRGKV
jgi:hypothetical protein